MFMRDAKVQMGEGPRAGKGDMEKEVGSVSMSWPQSVLPTLAFSSQPDYLLPPSRAVLKNL